MKLVLLKIKLSYQDSDKYKLHYYVPDMIRCCEYCGRFIHVAIQTKKWDLWKMNIKINNIVLIDLKIEKIEIMFTIMITES